MSKKQSKKQLTKEEELDLGRIIQHYVLTGEGEDEAVEAHGKIFESTMNLAYNIAWKLYNQTNCQHYEIEDLIQDALFALSKAIWLYDPSHDCRVSTFVYYRIYKDTSVAINQSRPISVSEYYMSFWNDIIQTRKEYPGNPSDTYSRDLWVAERLNIDIEFIDKLNRTINAHVSLDDFVAGDGPTSVLGDFVVDRTERKETTEVSQNIKDILNLLTEMEREIYDSALNLTPNARTREDILKLYGISVRKYNMTVKSISQRLKKMAESGGLEEAYALTQ